jgi:hypothetical protein
MKTIRKVKLKDDEHLIVDYILIEERDDGAPVERDITESIKKKLHPDLVKRFDRLRIHFGLIAEFIALEDISPDMFGELENFTAYEHKGVKQLICNQIILSGIGDDNGIQLAGRKILREGKPLNCITPLVKLHQDSTYYPFKVDLNNDIQMVLEEVEGALDGKFFESPQTEMKFEKPDLKISMNDENES